MSLLERVQSDATAALKSGDRERAGALRMIVSELQKAEKEGDRSGEIDGEVEVAVLQRERKRRLESAEAYVDGGRDDLARSERMEAELIEGYLPEQVPDAELDAIVDAAVQEAGASSMADTGTVMGLVMPKIKGRADGKRVSTAVRERLA